MLEHAVKKGCVVLDSQKARLTQRTAQTAQRSSPIRARRYDLGEHRIIERTDLLPLADSTIAAYPLARCRTPEFDATRLRHESSLWVFCIQAGLDGMSTELNIFLADP